MKRIIAIMATASAGLLAQKLETHRPDPAKVVRVETAKDHLTVIELSDAVTMVAVGNRGAFTVERRENKVFVTPTDDGARTNLFIWTSGGRYVYELVPAKDVDQMHFAIDQVANSVSSAAPPVSEALPEKTALLPEEMLTRARPISIAGQRETNDRIEVTLRDMYRKGSFLYLRYALSNRSGTGYRPSRPAVTRLEGARAQRSLLSLGDRQLGEKLARTVRADGETRLEVVDADQIESVAAGEQAAGWLVIQENGPRRDGVAVLKLQFAADTKGAVTAILVLPAANTAEVASVRPGGE